MRTQPRRLAWLALVALGGAMLPLVGSDAPAAAVASGSEVAAAPRTPLLAGSGTLESYVPPLVEPGEIGIESATIVVNYDLDFDNNPAAKTAFQHAIDIWEELLVSPVTIEIDADFKALGPGVLASAGPDTIHRNDCVPDEIANTWYPSTLANALCATDLNGSASEGGVSFNTAFPNYYYGLDGLPGSGNYDFVTVAVHEVGHILGFIGSMDVSGSTGSWGNIGFGPTGSPFIYDRFAENAADGTGAVLWTDFANPSTALKTQLTSDSVYFAGPLTMAANGGNGSRLYAPSTWSDGSSFSHLDESEYPQGDPNSLMTPIVNDGEAVHSPGPLMLAMFADMGWALPVAPDAPTGVVAVAGSNAARVTFTAPPNGGSAVTEYTVTASPGTAVETGPTPSIWIAGLDNGTPYTFTVTATNAFGTSPSSAPSGAVTPMLHGFHDLAPTRILDTRFGVGLVGPGGGAPPTGPLTPQQVLAVKVAGQGGVPLSGADAVVMNVTAVKPTSSGWLKVFPSDASTPNTSNLNFSAGQTVPNLVTVKLGADGKVKVANTDGSFGAGSTHVLFDVVGWYAADGSGAELEPETPTRVLDTRFGVAGADPRNTALAPQETYAVDIAGVGPVPSTASAVVMNVTAVTPTKSGWLTIFPSDQSLPTISNLNFSAGQTVPNLVEVELGADGAVKVNNSGGSAAAGFTHVIFDVVGWYGPTAGSGGLNADRPVRIFDTRFGVGLVGTGPGVPPSGALGPQAVVDVHVAGQGGVPSNGVSAVVMNVTAVTPTAKGWLTLWPDGTMPTASNLNFVAGKTVPNLVVVALGPGGTVRIGNTIGCTCSGFTHVIFDVVGWFADTP